jgi:hypothetical protein
MKWLRQVSEVRSFIDPIDAIVQPDKIVVGEFVDTEKPEFSDLLWEEIKSVQAGLEKTGRRTNVAL